MTSDLVWVLIRQDDGANRYRVGRYATRPRPSGSPTSSTAAGSRAGQKQGSAPERRDAIERVAPRLAQADGRTAGGGRRRAVRGRLLAARRTAPAALAGRWELPGGKAGAR